MTRAHADTLRHKSIHIIGFESCVCNLDLGFVRST